MSTRRDAYREVGAAFRVAVDRAVTAALAESREVRLTGADWRTLAVVLRLTASYSKLTDAVFVEEIAKIARLSERQTRTSLAKLARLGIIVWQPRRGTDAEGKGRPSTVGLPTDQDGSGVPIWSAQVKTANRNDSPHRSSGNREGTEEKVKTTLRTEGLRSTPTEAPRARETEPDEEELDRLWAESATPSRGYGWEPNG